MKGNPNGPNSKGKGNKKARVVSVDAAVDAYVPVKTALAGELPAAWTKRRKRQW